MYSESQPSNQVVQKKYMTNHAGCAEKKTHGSSQRARPVTLVPAKGPMVTLPRCSPTALDTPRPLDPSSASDARVRLDPRGDGAGILMTGMIQTWFFQIK